MSRETEAPGEMRAPRMGAGQSQNGVPAARGRFEADTKLFACKQAPTKVHTGVSILRRPRSQPKSSTTAINTIGTSAVFTNFSTEPSRSMS